MSEKIQLGNSIHRYQDAIHIGPGSDTTGIMSADITPTGINCINFSNIRFQINYGDVNNPAGAISLQRCETGLAADFVDFPLLSSMVTISTGDGVLNANGLIDISGVGAGRIDLNINDPAGFLLIKYTRSADGTGDVLLVRVGAN